MKLTDLDSYRKEPLLPPDVPIVYLCVDPNMGVGPETEIENYHIFSLRSHQTVQDLKNRRFHAVSHDAEAGTDPGVFNTAQLCRTDWFANHLTRLTGKGSPAPGVLVFKNSHRIEERLRKLGTRLLASPARLTGSLENKGGFNRLMGLLNIPTPAVHIGYLSSMRYPELVEKLGSDSLVIQRLRGFSGSRTVRVRSEDEFREVQDRWVAMEAKVTQWMEGISCSLIACRLPNTTVVSYPFLQLTGIPELTPNPLGACGNVWRKNWFPEERLDVLTEMVRGFGDQIGEMGYRGIFGLDFIFRPDTGDITFIEVNPRMTATVPIQTKLQIKNGEVPLLLLHVLIHLGISFDIDPDCFTTQRCVNADGSQLIFYSREEGESTLSTELKSGVYRFKEGKAVRTGNGYCATDLKSKDRALILIREPGDRIGERSEFARLQIRSPLLDGGGERKKEFGQWADVVLSETRFRRS
jgi:hypothetical protein